MRGLALSYIINVITSVSILKITNPEKVQKFENIFDKVSDVAVVYMQG